MDGPAISAREILPRICINKVDNCEITIPIMASLTKPPVMTVGNTRFNPTNDAVINRPSPLILIRFGL